MKLGVIGAGNLGRAVARAWAKANHDIILSSRHPDRLHAGAGQRVADIETCIDEADVLLLATPYRALPALGGRFATALVGKIVLDATNSKPDDHDELAETAHREGMAETTQAYLPGLRLVRAFSSINATSIDANSAALRFARPCRRSSRYSKRGRTHYNPMETHLKKGIKIMNQHNENQHAIEQDGISVERRALLKLTGAGAVALGASAPMLFADTASAQDVAPQSEGITIIRLGAEPTAFGPEKTFTGRVRIESLFQADEPARVGGGVITFDPGARTAWHTHPLGQTLIVTAGIGWVQREGGKVEEMRPGDLVWIRPGVKHWHGASADIGMTHIAIAEALDGKATTWMELVTDGQYRR